MNGEMKLPKLPRFPLGEPPTLSDKVPRMGEKVAPIVKDTLGDRGVGKVIGDVVGDVLTVADSVVVGAVRIGETLPKTVHRTLEEVGK